jgi:hypothetical protein
MSRAAFCHAMASLNLSRVMLVGDSIQFEMTGSLWKLLEHHDDPVSGRLNGRRVARDVACGSAGPPVRLVFILNDRLTTNSTAISPCAPEPRLWTPDICYPWLKEYQQGDEGTLLVAASANHFHSISHYAEALDGFLASVQRVRRPLDQLFFRLAVPGMCGEFSAPIAPEDVVLEAGGGTDGRPSYDWDLVPAFNEIARYKMRHAAASARVLDVYPMSILRPDARKGHGDCLHWWLPGVPDWWNHLLLAQLQEAGAGARI